MISIASDITILQSDPAEWDDLLRQFPNATIFHSLAWLRTISEAHGATPVLACAHTASKGGGCIGVWPFLETHKGPLRIIGSPLPGWSTAYLGPLVAPGVDAPHTVRAFLADKLFRRYAYFACKILDDDRPIDLTELGFSKTMEFDTYVIDLTLDEQTLWGNLKSECRTRIRKAQKHGVEIHEEQSADFIEDFWQMSIETFAKANIQPTHTLEFVQALWRHMDISRNLRVFSAMRDGERLGTLILPYDAHTMYYWGGAAYLKHRDIPSHNLLHWHAICAARQMGLQRYDMISTIGGPGRFKSTFGPSTVKMATHWERSPSKLMAALKDRYRKYLLNRRRVQMGDLVNSQA